MAVAGALWRAAARRGPCSLELTAPRSRRWVSGPAPAAAEEAVRPFAEMPGPKPLPVVGNVWRFLPVVGEWGGMDFLDIQWKLNREYGKIVKLAKMNENRDMVCLFDPADIEKAYRHEGPTPQRNGFESLDYYRRHTRKEMFDGAHGILTTNGKEWQDFRRRVQTHMLQPRAVAKYTAPIDTVSGELIQRLREIRDNNGVLPEDSINWLFRWALESVAVIALDARLDCLDPKMVSDSEQQRLIQSVHVLMDSMFELDVKPSPWRFISTPTWRRYVKALDLFEELVQRYIQEAVDRLTRKVASGKELGDDLSVLERLLLANENPKIAITMAMDMIFGGIDTTSYSTVMLLYYLSRNPDKQEKLFEELRRALPEKDTPVTSERLADMKYLRAAVKESMRMKPVVIGQIRQNVKDDLVLGNYEIPNGTDLILMTGVSGNLPEYVPEPHLFLPERWLTGEEKNSKGHPFSSLPFGFGPRKCIGSRIAELEIDILSAKILRNFRVEYEREAKFQTLFVHKMTSPLTFKLTDRQ